MENSKSRKKNLEVNANANRSVSMEGKREDYTDKRKGTEAPE